MEKDMIIEMLRKNGCRITRQRLILLDIILSNECSNCKEVYYRAAKEDSGIGMATVYRMISLLEEMGVISRNNLYCITEPS